MHPIISLFVNKHLSPWTMETASSSSNSTNGMPWVPSVHAMNIIVLIYFKDMLINFANDARPVLNCLKMPIEKEEPKCDADRASRTFFLLLFLWREGSDWPDGLNISERSKQVCRSWNFRLPQQQQRYNKKRIIQNDERAVSAHAALLPVHTICQRSTKHPVFVFISQMHPSSKNKKQRIVLTMDSWPWKTRWKKQLMMCVDWLKPSNDYN